jgi:hypothetical protein
MVHGELMMRRPSVSTTVPWRCGNACVEPSRCHPEIAQRPTSCAHPGTSRSNTTTQPAGIWGSVSLLPGTGTHQPPLDCVMQPARFRDQPSHVREIHAANAWGEVGIVTELARHQIAVIDAIAVSSSTSSGYRGQWRSDQLLNSTPPPPWTPAPRRLSHVLAGRLRRLDKKIGRAPNPQDPERRTVEASWWSLAVLGLAEPRSPGSSAVFGGVGVVGGRGMPNWESILHSTHCSL